jgi:cation diffusion facilitator family transporter
MMTFLLIHTSTQAIAIFMASLILIIVATARGMWALKWSCAGLLVTACFQLILMVFSGSVALLVDTIHNVSDAATALRLWVAFVLARRKPTERFTYGLGRLEDLAGLVIVLIMALSALVAGYEAIIRLFHPRPVAYLGIVAVASLIGFLAAGKRRVGSYGPAMVAIHGQRHNDVLRILQGELFVHEVIKFPLP